MMIEYKVESVEDCIDEIAPLIELHYEQVAMYKDKIPLNPDYDKYRELDKLGLFHCVTARDEGDLVGYFISFIAPHIHYSDHKFAVNDIVYIGEAYRSTGVGLDMFSFAEAALKDLGVSVLSIHMKTALPFDNLCKGLGYDYAERNYTKFIGD
jgi:GNAT superfamily N-acetyltransferase